MAAMRIIQRYIAGSFLTAFALSITVLTFVMSLGLVFHATALIARGVSAGMIFSFVLASAPETFAITIPLAALISSLLVFGRMSADSEISAMQSCGVSILSIFSMPLLLAGLLTVFGLYINDRVAPDSHYVRRRTVREAGIMTALQLLDEGRWVQDFPGINLWVGRRQGNKLYDVLIFERFQDGSPREIRASRAEVFEEGEDLILNLWDVRMEDPLDRGGAGSGSAELYPYVIPSVSRRRTYQRRENNYYFWELLSAMQTADFDYPDLPEEKRRQWESTLRVEFSKRTALALASFCFVLLGAPLGVRAQRRESSIGIAISLTVAMLFYLFLLLAQSLTNRPEYRPELVMMAPVIISLALGIFLTARAD